MAQKEVYYGNINVSKLVREVKKGNPAVYKSEKTGDIYLNINVFVSDEVDKFKNNGAIASSVSKEEEKSRFYLGNLKKSYKNEVDKKDTDNISL